MAVAQHSPKPIVPGLGGFYQAIEPAAYTLMRVAVGALILPHGLVKVSAFGKVVTMMSHFGFQPAWLVAALVTGTETLGGVLVVLGLLTRLGAAAIAIDMAVITFAIEWPHGFGRAESTLLWGIMAFVVALKGGGPYSLDRLIGWEL